MSTEHTIVVGVDGSDNARAALEWAFGEARLRKANLHVVTVWTYPYVIATPGAGAAAATLSELEDSAKATLSESIQAVVGAGDPDVRVTTAVTEGPVTRTLLDAAKGADLLVVGSRGRGGFAGLLLGSVSQSVSHHAPCPVVIVPLHPSH